MNETFWVCVGVAIAWVLFAADASDPAEKLRHNTADALGHAAEYVRGDQ